MFKKLSNLEEKFNLTNATIIIAVLTMLSRFTGFLRDLLLAKNIGLGPETDVYFTAFRIPDIIYNLLILGTLSVSFIPVFSKLLITDKARANRTANTVLNASLLIMAGFCLLVFVFAGPLTRLVAPGFSAEQQWQTTQLTRLLLLSPIIFTVSNVCSSILISLKKFLIVNTAPLLYNAGIIVGIVFFHPQLGVYGIGLGVILGAVLHLAIQVPQVYRAGMRWQPKLDIADPSAREIGRLFLPRVLGIDISYVNLIIVSVIGSTLTAGSIAAFNLANNIQTVALGVFAISTAIAVFPVLTELYAKAEFTNFIKSLQHAIIRVLYFVIPISVLLLIMRAHIVRILLGYGRCDWDCTIITFDTLGALALGLFAQSLIPLLARAFYATHNTKTPVYIGLISITINAFLSYSLAQGLGIQGVALGFVIASVINCILLYAALHRHLERSSPAEAMKKFDETIAKRVVKIIFASLLLGIVSYFLLYLMSTLVDNRTVIGLVLQAGTAGFFGLLIYVAVTKWLGLIEGQKISDSFAKALNYININ